MEKNVTKTKAWKKLALHYRFFKNVEMKNLFAFDAKRGSKYAVELGPLYLDYSKNRFNEKTLQYLLELADEVKLRDKIEAMFTGEKINITENRAVLHTALRNRQNTPVYVDGKNVMPEINAVLAKMKKFTDAVRYGEFKGATGKKLTSIVNALHRSGHAFRDWLRIIHHGIQPDSCARWKLLTQKLNHIGFHKWHITFLPSAFPVFLSALVADIA